MPSVLQDWVQDLTYMQQSVLITACRGPDGIKKDHIAKVLCRWLRRCFLLSAFDGKVLESPFERGGGSFTGPCVWEGKEDLLGALAEYFRHVDAIPHHFQLHLMHAAEIVGYKHPVEWKRKWWNACYLMMVSDMHLSPESEQTMDYRLCDNEEKWRAAEVVTAK